MSINVYDTLEDILKSEGYFIYKVHGKSMEPMIFQNDLVTIRKKGQDETFKENDVVLYRYKSKLVLHRIIQVYDEGKYVILGDNCSKKEFGITNENILGILIGFKRLGIHYETNDKNYIEYIKRLRRNEQKRMRHKLIYDILAQHLNILPLPIYISIKKKLKKLIVYNIHF